RMSADAVKSIGPYEVVGRLTPAAWAEAGKMGQVFLCSRAGAAELFVVHYVPAPSLDASAELDRFATLGAAHAAVPRLVEVVRAGGHLGLAFPQIEGVTVARVMERLERD